MKRPSFERLLAIGVCSLATLASALGCSSVPSISFDGGADEATEPQTTEPNACPRGAAPTPAKCCGAHWCYGDDCNCDDCTARCGQADQICCTKKNGPPAGRLTCKPLGDEC